MGKKVGKGTWITVAIVVLIVAFSFYVLTAEKGIDEGLAQCIGENSILYVQKGCIHCENQKKLFGASYKYLNEVDCFYERDLCNEKGISGTPTWIIDGESHEGVQSIDALKDFTGCEVQAEE